MENESLRACFKAVVAAGVLALANVAAGFSGADADEPRSVGDHAAVLAFSGALVGAAAASESLRRMARDRWAIAADVALAAAAVGGALAGLGNFGEDVLGGWPFALMFVFGGLALTVGLLVAGVAVLTEGAPWGPVGTTLLVVAIGILIGEEAGFALAGAAWILLARVLDRNEDLFAAG